jgi:hypothetical protein
VGDSRAYFAVSGDSVLAYQGVPGSFAGIQLTWPLGDTGIHFSTLPTDVQAKLRAGVAFPLSDLSKLEKLYSSKQATTTVPAPSAPTSATVGATSTTPAATSTAP